MGHSDVRFATGWQRSAAAGAAPPRAVGWLIRHNLAPFLPIVFLLFLLGLGREMDLTPIDQESRGSSVPTSMRQACVEGARKEIARNGGNADSAAMQAKVTAYCGCMSAALQREYMPDEFVRLASAPGQLDRDERMGRIIEACAKASSG